MLKNPITAIYRRLSISGQIAFLALVSLLVMVVCKWADWQASVPAIVIYLYILFSFGIRLKRTFQGLETYLNALCQGDLRSDFALAHGASDDALERNAQRLSQQLSQLVARIRSEAQLIAMSGEQATKQAKALSQRTESQAASLEQTRAALDSLLQLVQRTADQLRIADQNASSVQTVANGGLEQVQSAVQSMQRIEARSRKMQEVISVIDGIAFQTNILALNAAVEAARAGDAGRGFAVVASEVRQLANRSAQAASEVKQLIDSSNKEVAGGVETIVSSRRTLQNTVEGMRQVSALLREITLSSVDQARSLGEVSQAVGLLDDLTQQNAQMVDNSVGVADQLRRQGADLSNDVKSMRLREGCADEARAMAERAVEFIERMGSEAAVKEFHNPKGLFRDRDLYIVVADRDDYFRAFGSDPSKAGKRRSEALPGDDQAAIREASWRAADAGGGWIEFRAPHPMTKNKVEKLGYILPALNGNWAVQCSVNRGSVLS